MFVVDGAVVSEYLGLFSFPFKWDSTPWAYRAVMKIKWDMFAWHRLWDVPP